MDLYQLCGSVPAVPQLWTCPGSPCSLPTLLGKTSPACREAQKVGERLKFSNSREGSVAMKVFCDCFWNLEMVEGSLVAADVDSKQWRR